MESRDFTKYSVKEIVKKFQMKLNEVYAEGENLHNYYCGITNDPDERATWHGVTQFLLCAKCDSFETSSAVEQKLDEKGFDCGEQLENGRDNSVYVYMYKKEPGTTRE